MVDSYLSKKKKKKKKPRVNLLRDIYLSLSEKMPFTNDGRSHQDISSAATVKMS